VTEEDYREQIGYFAPSDPSHQVVFALDVTDDADLAPDGFRFPCPLARGPAADASGGRDVQLDHRGKEVWRRSRRERFPSPSRSPVGTRRAGIP
jgi:hypothetical protein